MYYLEFCKFIDKENKQIYYSTSDSNFGRLSILSWFLEVGFPCERFIEWLKSDSLSWGYNAIYFERLDNNIIQIGLEFELCEEPTVLFFIECNNFIDLVTQFSKLSKQLVPLIIVELDPVTHLLSCREATREEFLRGPYPRKVQSAKEILAEHAEKHSKRKFLEILLHRHPDTG